MTQDFDNNRSPHLHLSVVAYCDQPSQEAATCVFEARGGTIGRGEGNDLVLPDTENVVSRTHALVSYQNGEYLLTDQSTNGTFINDSPNRMEPGEAYPIQDGDRLLFGNYLVVASLVSVDSPAEGASPLLTERTQAPLFPDMESGEPASRAEQDEALPEMGEWPSDAQRPDWFPVGEEEVPEVPAEAESEERPPVPVLQQHLAQSAAPEPSEAEQPEIPGRGQDRIRGRGSGSVVPTGYIPGSVQFDETSGGALFPESSPEPEDPFASTSSAGEAPAEPPITGEAEEARPEQARPAAKAREPAPVTTPSALVMQKAGPAETVFGQAEKDLLEALLKGLGSSALKVSPDEAASFAVQIGQLVHEAVQGLIDTLRLRDEFKREFYVPVTRIAPTDNNLFKHSANVDDALARAFSGVGAAYLGPAESTRQAFQDIAAHHLALVAGMQAAIGSLLERFSPQALEQRIGKTTMLDGVLPQIRKAHMWEQFEKEYGQIAEQAEEDFQRVFGQQFERAYTQEILRLHSAGFGGSGREKED